MTMTPTTTMTTTHGTLRVAVGPFPDTEHDRWPLVDADTLHDEGFDVVAFGPDDVPPEADISLHWSPEYYPVPTSGPLHGYRVAIYGDWHIVPFERYASLLQSYDLCTADYRGTSRLRELVGPEKALYWRQFSYDPRLHSPPVADAQRDLDVAFLGRWTPLRGELLGRAQAHLTRTGRTGQLQVTPYTRGEEAPVYRRAKLVLGDSQRGELQMRAYEAMACGALYVCQHDTDEVWQARAPIPTYQTGDGQLEAFLDAWLNDEQARQTLVARQAAWVAHERPVDHLRWLLRRIRERLPVRPASTTHLPTTPPAPATSDAAEITRQAIAPPANEQRPEVCALIPQTARRVLDLGTHQGGVPWALRQRVPAPSVVGVDADPRVVDLARPRMDEFYAYDLNAGTWEAQPWYRPGHYDAVVLADIIEHVAWPWSFVRQVVSLLAPGGVVVASVPQLRNVGNVWDLVVRGRFDYFDHAAPGAQERWRGPQDNVLSIAHLRFFTRSSLTRLLEEAGLRVVQWASSSLSAPGAEAFVEDVAALVARYGGDVDGWRESSRVIQWLCVAQRAQAASPEAHVKEVG